MVSFFRRVNRIAAAALASWARVVVVIGATIAEVVAALADLVVAVALSKNKKARRKRQRHRREERRWGYACFQHNFA